MNKEIFTKLQANLETRITRCGIYLERLKTTADLRKLTLEQAQQLQKFCKEEEAAMTKLAQLDLYHIIGMGDLTPPQMMKFTYLVKEYLQYRGLIKTIAFNFDKISALPGLPVTSAYKLNAFENITLFTGAECSVVPDAPAVPYELSGTLIKVEPDKVQEFIRFWSKKAKVNFSASNFLQKANTCSEYGGVSWTINPTGEFVGVIRETNVRALFEGCYKAAQ